jgi:alpha/beta hydrolase fold
VVQIRRCAYRTGNPSFAWWMVQLGVGAGLQKPGWAIAVSAGVDAFVPDYRLAPEHLFPAATEDVRACYLGLIERGFSKVAITGDSAGGNLALGLLHFCRGPEGIGRCVPRGRSGAFAGH